MLTEICQYLKNWFDWNQPKIYGTFQIADGVITAVSGEDLGIQDGQYFRIIDSTFNDGVWKYGDTDNATNMKGETFSGSVWLLAIPREIIALSDEMDEWMKQYGGVNSPNMSPYSSESFGGYSYSKAQGYASAGGGMLNTVFATYASRLNLYKKL